MQVEFAPLVLNTHVLFPFRAYSVEYKTQDYFRCKDILVTNIYYNKQCDDTQVNK
jgi:hypothetical protein